jgi:hypothetical protein
LFLLQIELEFLLRKTVASLIFKIELWPLNISPELCSQGCLEINCNTFLRFEKI